MRHSLGKCIHTRILADSLIAVDGDRTRIDFPHLMVEHPPPNLADVSRDERIPDQDRRRWRQLGSDGAEAPGKTDGTLHPHPHLFGGA